MSEQASSVRTLPLSFEPERVLMTPEPHDFRSGEARIRSPVHETPLYFFGTSGKEALYLFFLLLKYRQKNTRMKRKTRPSRPKTKSWKTLKPNLAPSFQRFSNLFLALTQTRRRYSFRWIFQSTREVALLSKMMPFLSLQIVQQAKMNISLKI